MGIWKVMKKIGRWMRALAWSLLDAARKNIRLVALVLAVVVSLPLAAVLMPRPEMVLPPAPIPVEGQDFMVLVEPTVLMSMSGEMAMLPPGVVLVTYEYFVSAYQYLIEIGAITEESDGEGQEELRATPLAF